MIPDKNHDALLYHRSKQIVFLPSSSMRYTAIITTYQRPHALGRALRSVLQQTLRPSNVLVVDDANLTETQSVILATTERIVREDPARHLPAIVVIPNQGQGISAARNTGIRHAQSAWLAFLDDDDEWRPAKMHQQAKAVQAAAKQLRLCHTDEVWLRNGRHLNQSAHHKKTGGAIYARCLERCCISPSAVLMARSLVEAYGMFDPKLAVCEDYDMWLRICAYEEVAYVPEPLVVKHGGHADQLSRRHWGMDRFRVRALIKMMRDHHLDPAKHAATRTMLIKKLTILAQGAKKRNNRRRHRYYMDLLAHYAVHPDRHRAARSN